MTLTKSESHRRANIFNIFYVVLSRYAKAVTKKLRQVGLNTLSPQVGKYSKTGFYVLSCPKPYYS